MKSPHINNVFELLSESGFDVAAGLKEESLNDFFSAHFKKEESSADGLYHGKEKLQDLKLDYAYDVETPITLNLAPLTSKAFSKIFFGWVNTVPEIGRLNVSSEEHPTAFSLIDNPPPNVGVVVDRIRLTIQPEGGTPVILKIGLRVTGYIDVYQESGTHKIKITPIDIRLTDEGRVRADLEKQLRLKNYSNGSTNDPDCTALRQLVFHIANVVLARKIGSFVKEFGLPVPIRLFDGAAITQVQLEIVDKLLVVLGKVETGLLKSHDDWDDLFGSLTPSDLATTTKELSDRAEKEFRTNGGNSKRKVSIEKWKKSGYPDREVFIILHERLFQVLAEKLLIMEKSQEKSGDWLIFSYRYGWFMKTWDPAASIQNNTLIINLRFKGGGWARGCIETHCGDVCHTLSATAKAMPKIETVFYFEDDELWLSAKPRPFDINWDIGGLPWPFDKLVGFILDIFSNLGLAFVILLGKRWKKKIVTLPSQFPGTTLEFKASFDRKLIKDPNNAALMALGKIDFKP